MTLLSVVIPTIRGRDHWLDKARAAYTRYCDHVELIVLRNRSGCGVAWQEGSELATGRYLCFGADDIEPHEGWWQAAAAVCDKGMLPAPLILHTDGSVQSCGGTWEGLEPDGAVTEFTRAPFCTREQWKRIGPMIPTHYFTDNYFTHRGRQAGYETVVCQAYTMTHHLAAEGRDEGRMHADAAAFNQYVAGLA